MNFSAEQTAIFDHFREGKGNLVVEALAGTGKTTTIKEAFGHAPENRILYVVFNKKNQVEAESKITDHRVEVKTLHSLGFSIIKKVWSSAKPDGAVEYDRCIKAIGRDDRAMAAILGKVVSFAKNTLLKATQESIASMICAMDSLDINEDEVGYYAQAAFKVLELSKAKDAGNRISFDDMVWLPVEMDWCKPSYQLVCVDEAQDMNLPQLTMARGVCKGRMVVVGDSRQAIYGFRGAVQNGMGMMKIALSAKVLTLTTTYRCPKLVVELAAKLVPGYKAAEMNADGIVSAVGSADNARPGDVILSRLNAPLMPAALSFLRRNIPARIEGRDIGKQLIGMVKSFKALTIADLLAKISAWQSKQIERLTDVRNAEKRIEQIADIAETLRVLCDDVDSVPKVEQKINSLFDDTGEQSKPAVILSSVHKAKGLEWDRVFLLCSTFKPQKGGEEANIYYVALTRSKRELYLVGGEYTKPESKERGEPAKAVKSLSLPPPPKKKEAVQAQTTEIISQSITGIEDYDKRISAETICADETYYRLGDVITHGGAEYVCIRVSETSSLWKCSTKRLVSYEDTKTGKQVEFESPAKGQIRLCASHCGGKMIRMTKDEFSNFLSGKVRSGSKSNQPDETNNENEMKTEKVILTGIDNMIAKAIKAKKDDAAILTMCGTNYPEVKTASARKLIAKYRTEAETAPAKAAKTEGGKEKPMDVILRMANEGAKQDAITRAITKQFGEPSAQCAYLIGREWRRANNCLRAGPNRSAAPAKKSAPPAKKKSAPAPKPATKKTPPSKPAPEAESEPAPQPAPEEQPVE